jgi:glycosyltransferase involved in cell wall biosynthesis
MDQKHIGLIYEYNETWIGGTYYIENIINALKVLPENEKPFLHIFAKDEATYNKLQKKLVYPYSSFHPLSIKLSLFQKTLNFISLKLFNTYNIKGIKNEKEIEFYYPNPNAFIFKDVNPSKLVCWIPDFQEIHLPHYFSEEEKRSKAEERQYIALNAKNIVLSSFNAEKDFKKLYPRSKAKLNVLRFAVSSSVDATVTATEWEHIRLKYKIIGSYFLCPNQLWIHKNHITVIKAVALLKQANVNVLFTGKEEDYRNPTHPTKLKQLLKDYRIEYQVTFLGFIPKRDLDILIQKSYGIIQPSLFEGWNTALEEAKLKNKFIIASDIDVHKEQLKDYPNKIFFKKDEAAALAQIIKKITIDCKTYNYQKKVLAFARQFIHLN